MKMPDRTASSHEHASPSPPENLPHLFRQQRLLTRLAVYRPLAVLASIWIGLLAIALLAYGQLLHNAAENEPTALALPPATDYPHQRNGDTPTPVLEDAAPPETAAIVETEEDIADAITAGERMPGDMSFWTLLALVGTCAVGCWLLSLQIKSMGQAKAPGRRRWQPRGRRKPKHRRPPQASPVVAAQKQIHKPPTQGPQRLAPYNPERPIMAAAAPPSTPAVAPAAQPVPPAASPSAPPQNAAPTELSPPTATPEDVSVVDEQVQHRLDWDENSLVNAADVRQRRSLSSYL